jgi:uncharacterized protein (TIGR02391 family)
MERLALATFHHSNQQILNNGIDVIVRCDNSSLWALSSPYLPKPGIYTVLSNISSYQMTLSEEEVGNRIGELEEIADRIEDLLNNFFAKMETREWFKLSDKFIIYEWMSQDDGVKQTRRRILKEYEKWFASVKPLIEAHRPDRLENFEEKYNEFKLTVNLDEEVVVPEDPAIACANTIDTFHDQRNLLNTILNKIDLGPLLDSEANELYLGSPDELFDDEIVSQCFNHFHRGDFQNAIQNAFIVLEERIRNYGNLPQDEVGRNLAQKAFEPDSGPLRFGETGAERAGAKNLYTGAFMTYRNPSSHRMKKNLDRKQSYSILCLVNLLLGSLPENPK